MKKINSLRVYWEKVQEERKFQDFDIFLVGKMLGVEAKNYTEEERREAYHIFRQKTNHYGFASLPTMKRWFGIGGIAKPKRVVIFEMAIIMGMSEEELQEYLSQGLREHFVQINDYQEMIFFYALMHHMSIDNCYEMMEKYESKLDCAIEILHTYSTMELAKQFQVKKDLTLDEFMCWMTENAGIFKGYSNTTLNYLIKYRRIILREVRNDMKGVLWEQLSQTNYEAWKKRPLRKMLEEGEMIRKFIYYNKNISDSQRKELLKLVQCVYFEDETNVRLLAAVYSIQHSKWKIKKADEKSVLHRMTEKRLSDLLNISVQKERELRLAQAERELSRMEKGEDPCPTKLQELIKGYNEEAKVDCIDEARKWVQEARSEQGRRCVQVARGDLLPLVLHVAQHRYLESIQGNMESYDWKKAQAEFIELADQTMVACNMAKISTQWELDSILLACFQPDDLFSYADALEIIT